MAGKNQDARSNRRQSSSDAKVFKALANQDRRRILDALQTGRKTTKEVCKVLPHLDRCTVMLHLRVLAEAELVVPMREGRCRWNYLNVAPIQGIYNRWIKDYAAPTAALMTELKQALENV